MPPAEGRPAGLRWPPLVYDEGTEPDPRFSLANERTFLAWIRTSLALLAGAAALDVVDLDLPPAVQRAIALVLAAAALLSAVHSWRAWAASERAMRRGDPLPSHLTGLLVALAVAVAAVVLAVGVALR